MSILLKHANIPKYGHRIVILSDGHAYYEDFINPYVDMGEVITVPPHGRLIDADALLDVWDDNHTIPSTAAKVLEKTVIPADKEEE